MWMTPELLDGIPELLRDPATPIEPLRQTALDGHRLILSAYRTVDSAIAFMLIISAGAAIMLCYVAIRLRRYANGGEGNAL
jgi:hypothetical protein